MALSGSQITRNNNYYPGMAYSGFTAKAAASIIIAEGLEYTLKIKPLHYDVNVLPLHYDLNINPLHYTLNLDNE